MEAMESNQSSRRSSNNHVRLVNWDLAAATAAKLAPAGPKMSAREIAAAVANLRELADQSVEHVHRITGLEAARDLRDSQVLIVDRATWAKANTQSFEALLQPTLDHLAETRKDQLQPAATALSGTVTGAQFGSILAFLSSKVLGQYDPFAALGREAGAAGSSGASAGGRLMFVAPNVISVERELNVEPADFRLWVALHEQTHRVQFAAAPWLRDHMVEQIGELTGGLLDKAEGLSQRLGQAVKNLGEAASGRSDRHDDGVPGRRDGVLSLLQDPKDKERLSHLTAVMSLLEGHANVVMDEVDAQIVPTVKTIRQRFNARSKDRGALEKFLRQVLGLEAKMRQYSDGAKFVRGVVAKAGMEGFNHVWAGPGNLPTEPEIHKPQLWIDRMGL
jgi:coenzyme F420 biosynthesis associated uncharacterized protein